MVDHNWGLVSWGAWVLARLRQRLYQRPCERDVVAYHGAATRRTGATYWSQYVEEAASEDAASSALDSALSPSAYDHQNDSR
jgi:hypothetical protein